MTEMKLELSVIPQDLEVRCKCLLVTHRIGGSALSSIAIQLIFSSFPNRGSARWQKGDPAYIREDSGFHSTTTVGSDMSLG